ncbi:MAG: hypothetical protein V3V39_14165 [Desulfobacterales bacterium]
MNRNRRWLLFAGDLNDRLMLAQESDQRSIADIALNKAFDWVQKSIKNIISQKFFC